MSTYLDRLINLDHLDVEHMKLETKIPHMRKSKEQPILRGEFVWDKDTVRKDGRKKKSKSQ